MHVVLIVDQMCCYDVIHFHLIPSSNGQRGLLFQIFLLTFLLRWVLTVLNYIFTSPRVDVRQWALKTQAFDRYLWKTTVFLNVSAFLSAHVPKSGNTQILDQ